MKWLRKILDSQAPLFKENGKLEKLYPLYEAADTFLHLDSVPHKEASPLLSASHEATAERIVMFLEEKALLPVTPYSI